LPAPLRYKVKRKKKNDQENPVAAARYKNDRPNQQAKANKQPPFPSSSIFPFPPGNKENETKKLARVSSSSKK
jgi:hypothetical protein